MSKCHVCHEETNPMPPHRDVVVVDVTTAREKGVQWGLYHEICYKEMMKKRDAELLKQENGTVEGIV